MAVARESLYKQAVEISEEYLGPAGERFIRRQITTHLGTEPEKLAKKDVPQLVNWVGLAFALLTNNQAEVEGFTEDLLALTKSAR